MKFLLVVAGVAALAEAKREARAFTPNKGPACTIGCITKGGDYTCPQGCIETTSGCRYNNLNNAPCGYKSKVSTLCYVDDGPCGFRQCLDDKTGKYDLLPVGQHQGHCPEVHPCLLCKQAQESTDHGKKCADICKKSCEGWKSKGFDEFTTYEACELAKAGKLL